MLRLQKLECYLDHKPVLRGINADFDAGKIHMIIGPNGAGKSTLLKAVSGLLKYSGSVLLDDQNLQDHNYAQNAKKLSLMSQFQQTPPLTVKELLSLGRRPFCGFSLKNEDKKIINDTIKEFALEEFLDRDLQSLSGGERQKVYLAKSLIQTPKLLLLDEPISHLDPKMQMDILNGVKKATLEQNLITLIVMHDLQSAMHYGDSVLMLRQGRLLHHIGVDEIETSMLDNIFDIKCKIFHHEGHPFVHLGHKHVQKPHYKHIHNLHK